MKRILLTGGNGFIGRNIRESYLARKYEIVSPSHTEVPWSDTDAVDAWFAGQAPFDATIHAAVKPGHRNAPDHTQLLYTNTRMFFNLVRHARQCGRILNIGSGAIYGMQKDVIGAKEEDFGIHVPEDEHGFTKYVCGKYMEACGEDVVDLRVFGIFGKYEDYAIRFISNAICKTLFDLPVTLRQDRVFSYLAVEDLMQVLDAFVENRPRFKAYNVVPDERSSLLALARMIVRISGKDLPVHVGKPGTGLEYSGDNARLKEEWAVWNSGQKPDADGSTGTVISSGERDTSIETGRFHSISGSTAWNGRAALHFTPMEEAVRRLYTWYAEHKPELDRDCLLADK